MSFMNEILDMDNNGELLDMQVLKFINMVNNKESDKIPEPTYFRISTYSAKCKIDNTENIDLSKIVVFISKSIIKNIVLENNLNYLIRGIVVDNLIIRYDEIHLKKYKKPYIKYFGNMININNKEECLLMLSNMELLENNLLKNHGRQKNKKDNEYFYNSCSIIVKGNLDTKCVNIKLFNNGKITLTGGKRELDGYEASRVLLEEMKKDKEIFVDMNEEDVSKLQIVNYKITMINSDFNTNFKINLFKFYFLFDSVG